MEIEDRIMKAKVRIVNGNPFFAYLTLYLPIAEDKQGLIDEYGGMCVTQDDKIFYKPEYVNKIDDDELIFSVLHEVGHRAFLHIERGEGKAHFKWNVAIDLMINTLLKNNGFKAPKGVLLPNEYDQFIIMNKTIDKISEKSAEEIYDELPEIPEPKTRKIYVFFDNHVKGKEGLDGKGSDGKPNNKNNRIEVSSAETNKIEEEWLNRVQTATIQAKQRGVLPAGMERFVENLSKVEISWQTHLRRYIQQSIPNDYTWCLEENTKILTTKGYTPIKKIRQGRNVIGFKKGKLVYSKVKRKFKTKVIEKMYIIKTKNGNILKCSEDHKILTNKGYIKAKDLLKGDRVKIIQ